MAGVADRFQRDISLPPPRVLLPESHDERVVEAATIAANQDIVRPVMFDPGASARRAFQEQGLDMDQIEFKNGDVSEYADIYSDLRDVSTSTAQTLLEEEIILAALLLRLNEVDAIAAGATRASGEVLSIYNGIIGLAPDCGTVSSAIIIETGKPAIGEDSALVYADCAMNVLPSRERLADIATSTAETTAELFDCTPKVAMLSFSTKGSSDHELAHKVREATQLAQDRIERGCVEGELQLDAALIPEVRESKIDDPSPCLDGINTLIFPNIDAANIAVKISEYLADMNMVGAVLQGYARPLGEISRGSDSETIVELLTAVALLAQRKRYSWDGEIISGGRLREREKELE